MITTTPITAPATIPTFNPIRQHFLRWPHFVAWQHRDFIGTSFHSREHFSKLIEHPISIEHPTSIEHSKGRILRSCWNIEHRSVRYFETA